MNPPIVNSFYKSNIPQSMLDAQKQVFDHLAIPLKQWKDDTSSHGDWMDNVIAQTDSDILVFADIDAFPLKRDAFDRVVKQAKNDIIVGLAQVTNHKDPTRVYAAPMFLAFKRSVFEQLGSPSMLPTKSGDVAQTLTDLALQHGVGTDLIYPTFSMLPRWALANHGVYGIGTFYGQNEFFHLFESRRTASQKLFSAVAEGVVAGKHNWQLYLDIMEQAPARRKKKKLFGIFKY